MFYAVKMLTFSLCFYLSLLLAFYYYYVKILLYKKFNGIAAYILDLLMEYLCDISLTRHHIAGVRLQFEVTDDKLKHVYVPQGSHLDFMLGWSHIIQGISLYYTINMFLRNNRPIMI